MVYATLSYSLTLTLNFWSFALIFLASAIALNYWIRSRYLNIYVKLKEQPLVKENAQELHPDVNGPEAAPTFHNYLDEFLQAVRIFGFLEKPVFHELARHLQTRRLVAGDSIALDEDKSFYCVVDGTVQVFARTDYPERQDDGTTWDEEDMNGYRLLNEVKSGGTLSSLFTILSLFTEDVHISWQDETDKDTVIAEPVQPFMQLVQRQAFYKNADVPRFSLDSSAPRLRGSRRQGSGATIVELNPSSPAPHQGPYYSTRPLSPDGIHSQSRNDSFASSASQPHSSTRPPSDPQTPAPSKLDTVARATEDSTLAVIPAEAFRRLTKKFPKASAHIVQVILTRLSRVTFTAAHDYLGLTSEVLRTEKAINEIACHPLPPSFYEGGGLQYLRQRFDKNVTEPEDEDEGDYFSFASNPLSSSEAISSAEKTKLPDSSASGSDTGRVSSLPTPIFRTQSSMKLVQAGDLHTVGRSNVVYRPFPRRLSTLHSRSSASGRSSRSGSHPAKDAPRLEGNENEFDLRDEVMSCIAKSIGLLQQPMSDDGSRSASPAFGASEVGTSKSRQTPFTSSFGGLSLLEMGDDMSSVTGASSVINNNGNSMSGLDNDVEILFFAAGSILARAGERNTGLFYVIDGFLDVSLPVSEPKPVSNNAKSRRESRRPSNEFGRGVRFADEKPRPGIFGDSKPGDNKTSKLLFTVKPGGIAGYLSSLCNLESYVDIQAKTDTYVGFLPAKSLEKLLEKRPIVLLTLAKRLISLLSPLVKHIDSSLDWMHVDAGQVLWRPEDEPDSFYIVINGRLRAITENEQGGITIVGEFGLGDTVGELDVVMGSLRGNTVHAIRDTELIRMPRTLFNAISSRHPQTTAQILRMIASRVRSQVDSVARNGLESSRSTANLRTVAILPSRAQVPVNAFARKLHAALEAMGAPTAYLNQVAVSNHLGRHAFTRMGKLKTAGWLADQEQRYRMVLYVADSTVTSSWTQTCIRQADCVMVLGMGDDPSLGEYERLLLSMKTTARKELVLLHPDRSVLPGSTREWLKLRPFVHQHIHVELPGLVTPDTKANSNLPEDVAAVAALKNLKDRVQTGIKRYRGIHTSVRPQRPAHSNDFARLARRICGKSVGLILGGGGARGISHLGVIRALEEYGIPIDHIGGTSIGAFVGGLYAQEGDIISSAGRAKQFSGRMSNIWRLLSDVTYPMVAYTTGHEFNRSIYKAFYDSHIEDMWLPFFTNTSNITTSQMLIHETGYAWRFIRASMTLVGLLPPLCDDNGHMLVDGGYMDNLPVSSMFSMGANAVIASDVGSIDDNSPRQFGDYVSGWWLLINRFNPFSGLHGAPAITEIQSRLAYVSSVRTLEEAKVTKGCLYMQMPVQEFGTLQFGKFEEIREKGYQAAIKMLEKFEEDGRLPSIVEGELAAHKTKHKGRSARRNSV